MDAFYRQEINGLRGVDRIGYLRLSLEDAHQNQLPFKGFLLGHPGVGKTTELRRLLLGLEGRFRPLYLSVTSELNPGTLRFYDVLLLILIKLVYEASLPEVIGFEDTDLKKMLDWVRDHLAHRWVKHLRVDQKELGGGVNIPFLKLFGNIKLGTTRERGKEEYELSFVSELVELMNRVLAECNRLLAKHQNGRQWVIVLEDFEKIGLSPSLVKDLFIGLRPSFEGFDADFIAVIPVWLQYSEDAGIVLPSNFQSFPIPDIPVYDRHHLENAEVIAALKAVVTARIDSRLFDPGVLDRFCIASGGNLRDLFSLIQSAMLNARLRGSSAISSEDADLAINALRNDYKQLLGSTGLDPNDASLPEKLDRLVGIYKGDDKTADVPNRILYQLLQQRCVLQYNGTGWKGVHPLVVDLLMEFEKLPENSPGGSEA
ncbi:MAG TPA: hypothetical protein VIY49_14390 [Bryobacteraceae bacterium]